MVELILENTLVTDMLAWTGIQSRVHATSGARFDAADNIADSLRRAITDLYLEFYQPDGIILNPAQGETLELLKDDNNQYMRVYDSATMRLWRVPVVETAAMTAGTALVGNFKLGVTVWDREQTQILTGQPSDYFLRNAFAILAELRAAWAVTRPLALEKVTGL
jgi:HK97 family phage major capsid protein